MSKTAEAMARYRAGKASAGGAGGSLSGNVSFEQIINSSPNTMNIGDKGGFSLFMEKGNATVVDKVSKKSDLKKLIQRNNISSITVHGYRGKSTDNALSRFSDLGFDVQAQYKGTGTERQVDYYLLKKRR